MIPILVCAMLLSQSGEANSPPEPIKKYLQRCLDAKATAIRAKEKELQALAGQGKPDAEQKLQAELKKLRDQPAPLASLPLPPAKDDMGVLAADPRLPRSILVLEVVAGNEAIIRAWYVPDGTVSAQTAAEDSTFVDLWVQGIDTSGLTAKKRATLSQVFQVIGNKVFDTTCGKRSLPLIEPVDIERYRKSDQK